MGKEKEEIILDDADRLLSVPEVSERMHTSPAFVCELIKLELLPAIWFGTRPRVPKSAFNRFIEKYIGQDLRAVAKTADMADSLKAIGG